MPSFISELARRNVFRVGVAYIVVSWLVLQVLDLVFENIGAPDWVMKVIMVLLAVGFPLALLFSWAYEITPEGLKREAEVDRNQSITGHTSKKLDRLIIIILVAIVAVMGIERTWFADTAVTGPTPAVATIDRAKSIAVLPFSDLSETQDQEWFGDGLSEEILNALMRTPDLLVASRTSSFKYKKSDKDIREIANELGVEHVLEGSVRRAGDNIRVTAQLVRASDGFHVWSQNYDRELQDVIAIQENLAIEIARALETGMDPDALASMMRIGTRSVAAYEHYINGLALYAQSSEAGDNELYFQAYQKFEAARREDPRFAAAHANAAAFWQEQLRSSSRQNLLQDDPDDAYMPNFTQRMQLAIQYAPDAVTRSIYEGRHAFIQLDLRKTIEVLTLAVKERPNEYSAWQVLMLAASFASDRVTLQWVQDRMLELADINPEYAGFAVLSGLSLQQPSIAITIVRKVLAMHPEHREVVYQSHRMLLWAGRIEEAAALLPRLVGDVWYPTAAMRQACAEGDRARAERIHADTADTAVGPDWHSEMILGNADLALAALQSLPVRRIPTSRASFLLYPQFDPAPFPELDAILEREQVERPPVVEIPFACEPE